MVTKYYAVVWNLTEIFKVKVIKETKKFVVLNPKHKDSKLTKAYGYFDSWEDARSFLLDRLEEKVKQYSQTLHYYENQRDLARQLTEANIKEFPV